MTSRSPRCWTPTWPATRQPPWTRSKPLADGGRDMAQVAAQAEVEARRLLLASAADPPAARRLATILRTLAEAAAAGAREGRARLAMELLAVEQAFAGDRGRGCRAAQAQCQRPARRRGARRRSPPSRPPSRSPPRTEPRPSRRVRSRSPRRTIARSRRLVRRHRRPTAWPASAPAGRRWLPHATPGASKPLLRECRPVALDGARLTLAFPEERGFMREKVTNRGRQHRAAAGHRARRHLGGRLHRQQCGARAAHGAAGGRIGCQAIRTARPCWRASCASPAVSWSTRLRSADLVSIHAAPRAGFASQS